METSAELLFLLGVAFLHNHELDAIRRGEWRIFSQWASFSDDVGYRLFTALHVPLYIFIMWFLPDQPFQVGFNIFLIVHAILHGLLRNQPELDFNNGFSRLWIFGGAVIGVTHLIVLSV